MPNYRFHPTLILRTPNESFDSSMSHEDVIKHVQNDAFLEAIYLASPNLYQAAITWKLDEFSETDIHKKTIISLTKYIIRNRSRSTPFGLFSGIGTVHWGEKSDISIQKKFDRHTRLDMNYLCALAQSLQKHPTIRKNVLFFPNTSHYIIGENIRYIEYHYVASKKIHQISAIQTNDFIEKVLAITQYGAQIDTIIESIVDNDISTEEAMDFVEELIDAQLLVSELEPAITGAEFLIQMTHILKRCVQSTPDTYLLHVLTTLETIEELLGQLDDRNVNEQSSYQKIIDLIETLSIDFEESKLFQTDCVLNVDTTHNIIDESYQGIILDVCRKLSLLTKQIENTNLTEFKKRFYDRYEDDEIPLLHALDTETGVGYLAHHSGDYTPLTEDIRLPEKKNQHSISWQSVQQKLFNALQKATQDGSYEISFSSIGLENRTEIQNMSPSISVMFRLVDANRIFVETIGGSSAANLIGRFAHAAPEIGDILSDIRTEEENTNPDVIFAEIVHLPENRTGNILLRPAFRSYEIPYLAKSSLPQENQIKLQDLLVSIRYNRVVLRHKKHNKIIIPRLGTAHNFTHNALPVYQFLCDLQTQDLLPGVGFSWGEIANEFIFLPRVVEGKAILHLATWQFSEEHFQTLKKKATLSEFQHWKKHYKLPNCFVLCEGDNELFINSLEPLLVEMFLATIKTKSSLLIKEYLLDTRVPIKNYRGNYMANQLVATLIRNQAVYEYQGTNIRKTEVQRTFSIGSEWIYIKLYCGARSADTILQEGVQQVVTYALMNGYIDKWFFIRYNDPNYHLRVRFHVNDTTYIQHLLELIEMYIKPFEKNGFIWKIQADTYQRELERYGYEAVHWCEYLFFVDSQMYLDFLATTEGDERENIKWLWGMWSIDFFLAQTKMTLPQKRDFIENLRTRFAHEFGMNQDLKSQLDKKYRTHRTDITSFLTLPNDLWEIQKKYENQLVNGWENIVSLVKEDAAIVTIMESYVHMIINRLISSNQRLHELLMYDFLYRHYHSLIAQQKQ